MSNTNGPFVLARTAAYFREEILVNMYYNIAVKTEICCCEFNLSIKWENVADTNNPERFQKFQAFLFIIKAYMFFIKSNVFYRSIGWNLKSRVAIIYYSLNVYARYGNCPKKIHLSWRKVCQRYWLCPYGLNKYKTYFVDELNFLFVVKWILTRTTWVL